MGPLDAIVPEEPHRIVLVEDGDTLVLLDALAHDVRGTEVVLAHDHVDLGRQACQVECLLAGGIATTADGDLLATVEEAVTGSTGRDPHTGVLRLILEAEVLGGGTRGDDDRVGLDLYAVAEGDDIGALGEVYLGGQTRAYLSAEALGLLAQVLHQDGTRDALGVAGEVLHLCGLCELAAGLYALIEEGCEVGASRIDGGGVACWA